tara:strand:+ start:1134 stop:1463 length:330 start_codon:yes stop_codon:yes gene_type:complete
MSKPSKADWLEYHLALELPGGAEKHRALQWGGAYIYLESKVRAPDVTVAVEAGRAACEAMEARAMTDESWTVYGAYEVAEEGAWVLLFRVHGWSLAPGADGFRSKDHGS